MIALTKALAVLAPTTIPVVIVPRTSRAAIRIPHVSLEMSLVSIPNHFMVCRVSIAIAVSPQRFFPPTHSTPLLPIN